MLDADHLDAGVHGEVNVGAAGASETGDLRLQAASAQRLYDREVLLDHGDAHFDGAGAERVQFPRELDLLVQRERHAGSLLAVPQGHIVDVVRPAKVERLAKLGREVHGRCPRLIRPEIRFAFERHIIEFKHCQLTSSSWTRSMAS